MRKFLIRVIVAFTKLITSLMIKRRRDDVFWGAAKELYTLDTIKTTEKDGNLLLDASCKYSVALVGGDRNTVENNEPDTTKWIYSMQDGACLWDIGSNVGIYGLLACMNSTVRVVAFEPAASNFAILNRNIELNNFDERFQTYCIAFSEHTKLDSLNLSDTSAASSMHGFGTESDQFERAIRTKFRQGCIGFSIDDFVDTFAPPLPTHIKIDVDGLEPDILRGGKHTLSDTSVKSVIVEVEEKPGASRSREILNLMTEFGFRARSKENPKHRNVIFDRIPE